MNRNICRPPAILEGCTDDRWTNNTIYNHYESPIDFMDAVIAECNSSTASDKAKDYIAKGINKFNRISEKDITYSDLYKDVAENVRDKLITRGFTTSMLYSTVGFTTENTGLICKQRAMLGRRDCFFKNPQVDGGKKLFHDIYINLSYSWSVRDSKIERNSYALYALTKELSRVIPMRVIVVNHVGTDTPTCYSYVLKKFGQPIKPDEFLFFTSDSKRTFGWATYDILNDGDSDDSEVGHPTNSVSIASFDLDETIDEIFVKIKTHAPGLFKIV